MSQPTNLIERLAAGCDCSVTCQQLHAEALAVIEGLTGEVDDGAEAVLAEAISANYPNHFIAKACLRALAENGYRIVKAGETDDEAAILAEAKAIAKSDWYGEMTVADVWAALEPSEQQDYLINARAARAARGEG